MKQLIWYQNIAKTLYFPNIPATYPFPYPEMKEKSYNVPNFQKFAKMCIYYLPWLVLVLPTNQNLLEILNNVHLLELVPTLYYCFQIYPIVGCFILLPFIIRILGVAILDCSYHGNGHLQQLPASRNEKYMLLSFPTIP